MTAKKKLIRTFKRSKAYKSEDNNQAAKKVLGCAGTINCSFCPPWKHDNKIGRSPSKHGAKKPKYKNKRG